MNRDLLKGLIRRPGFPLLGWVLGAGLAAAFGAMVWLRGPEAPRAEAPPPAVAGADGPRADVPLPQTGDSDAQLRAQLGKVTPTSRFHDWLSAADLLRRWVAATDEIAADVSPRAELPFLQPDRPFKVAQTWRGTEISPVAYERFDAVGNVAGSIDAQRFAEVYRSLHPLLESAYHQLGYPGGSFDAVTARALQRISDAPVRDRAPRLERAGSLYLFADTSLESLGPVEKALLRMGPRNTRLVQQSAHDIATALGLPLQHPPQAAQ